MKVNTKIRYGLRAMVEIAKHTNSGGIYQKEIAEKQNLSVKYLDHIISNLKIADLIRKDGPRGGYVLSRNSDEITMYDLYNAFERDVNIVDCVKGDVDCSLIEGCDAYGFWCELNGVITRKMKSVTLKDLANTD